MKTRNWISMAAGVFLALLAVWQIRAAASGLVIRSLRGSDPPVSYIAPRVSDAATRPLVLIGHGFAGSQELMRGFALTLAHAGYQTVLWDFTGHAANPERMPSNRDSGLLAADAESALEQARIQLGASGPVAILGHSMGSGVALYYGRSHPDTAATMAISPVNQPVTPELPRNLLLIAGSLEQPFVRTAERLLAQAGGAGGDPAAGSARALVVVPGVEHVSILFDPVAHDIARDWVNSVFGIQPGSQPYRDLRIVWYAVGLAGILLAFGGLAPWVQGGLPAPAEPGQAPLWQRLLALPFGALVSASVLWLLGQFGLNLTGLFGITVGGYLLLWFGIAGAVALLFLARSIRRPTRRELLGGVLAFAALWIGVGLLGQMVWLHWLLIPARLALWPLGALLTFTWFLAVCAAFRPQGWLGWVGVWLLHSLVVVGVLLLVLQINPELRFLLIILPLFPLVLALHMMAHGVYKSAWVGALSGALFVSWMLLAVFPLQ